MAREKRESKTKELKGGKKTDWEFVAQLAIIGILVVAIFYGAIKMASPAGVATGIGMVSASDIIPTGVPAVYGKELGVNYDDISQSNPQLADATIAKLAKYEDMQLDNATMQRYIKIAGSISCEYCCGAQALIFSNGDRACGCDHSYAMRGLAKYLLTNHPDMTDDEILSELGKWKTLFFPGIMETKAAVMKQNGISADYISLASNEYRGIEYQTLKTGSSSSGSSSSGAMVGDC